MEASCGPVRHRVLVAAVAAAVLTACSSTNAPSSVGDVTGPSPTATLSVPVGADGKALTKEQIARAVKQGRLPASALSATQSAAPGATTDAPRPTTATGATRIPSAGLSGPGFSPSELKLGISLFQPGSVAETFGIDAAFGDGRKQAEAVVKYVNAHGGIAGRTVKPVYYTVDFGRAGSYTDGSFEAEACELWTNDNRVFAAVNNAMSRTALLSCLAKQGVPGIHDGMSIDEKRLATYRDYYYSGAGPKALT
ncbi:MAG: hypothetical protein M3P04_04680, partial [Actinomycetota bacterium]|nr:hypothetical protein [Actinomycetota bacterium]